MQDESRPSHMAAGQDGRFPELVEPPFYGASDMLVWEARTLLDGIDKRKLFRGVWGRGLGAHDLDRTINTEFGPASDRLTAEILSGGLVDARGIYGLFPVFTHGEDVVVLDPDDFSTELVSWKFPRGEGPDGRCVADAFRPDGDIIGLWAVTVGPVLERRAAELSRGDVTSRLGELMDGLGEFLAEELADRAANEIRRALLSERGSGKRLVFGSPGLPPISHLSELARIVGCEERLGMEVTPEGAVGPRHAKLGIFVRGALRQ